MKGKLILTVEEAEKDHAKWLSVRNDGIGGSDIGAIMGINPWKSAYALWAEKTGQVEAEDLSDKEFVYWGTTLEQVVANRFCELTDKKVRKCGTLADEEYPFLHANVDRLIIGENAGLECKTANGFKSKEWADDNMPDSYYLQVQFYMMVTGCDKWYVACLIGGNHFVWKEVPRNEEQIKAIREAAIKFWTENVEKKVAPVVDGSDATTELINEKYPSSKDVALALPSSAEEWIRRLDELAVTEKLLKNQKAQAQNAIKLMLGDAESGSYQDRVVSWKEQAGRVTIDSKKLQEQFPQAYEACKKEGKPTRVFRLK